MSVKTRFLNSVSGVALTAALMSVAMPARADTDDASGAAQPFGAGFNQNWTVTTVPTVEAESTDPSNTVEVTGIVYGTAAFNHLNAIGVYVDQWDIEASGAEDFESGIGASALAVNSATVAGSIIGAIANPDFAPGSGSYGVRVADDIQAEDAEAFADYSGAGNPSVTAIARNNIVAAGTVAGSAVNSFGVRVDGDVQSSFAAAGLRIDNYTSPTDIASGSAQALNFVSIAGTVGGEGASDGSIGFFVGGDVYAEEASADGDTYISIPALNFYGFPVGSVWGSGQVSGNFVGSNTVGITGAVIGDGGNLAIGADIAGSAYAEGAFAAGEALSDGFQDVASAAFINLAATNTVVIEGAVSGLQGPATGVRVNEVWAEGAVAIGEGIAAFAPDYYTGTTPSALAEIEAVAGNAVSITGVASVAEGLGVSVGGSVYAEGASAEGFAGTNIYGRPENVPLSDAMATARATNTVVVVGLAQASEAKGVQIGGDIFAEGAEAEAVADSYARFTAAPEGITSLADAGASVTSVASNAVTVIGVVDASLTNAAGVDPEDIYAENADSYHSAFASANSVDGAGAMADANGDGTASNIAAVTGTIGDGASGSVGVALLGEVEAQYSFAEGYSYATATQTNNSVSTAGATATAVNNVTAANSAVVNGILGNSVTGSTGVDIGMDVDADEAVAYGGVDAFATVTGGDVADALATGEGNVSASNTAVVAGIVGTHAVDSYGVRIDGFDSFLGDSGVDADDAYADGYVNSYAYNYNSGGSATANAMGTVSASSLGAVSGNLGDEATNSVGVWIGEGRVGAFDAIAFGRTYGYAQLIDGQGNGDAIANSDNSVSATNTAQALGVLGNAAEGSTGVWMGEGGVVAIFAEANGYAEAFATLSGGDDSDAIADASGNVASGNTAGVVGILGMDAHGSVGVSIGEGIGAFGAFAEGGASANAYNDLTAGDATAIANNLVSAGNLASAVGQIGDFALDSTGAYLGEGVAAADAFAEGSAYANAQLTNNDGAGLASATASNEVSATNTASIVGTVGAGAEGSVGVLSDDSSFIFLPFTGPVEMGLAAVNAFAESTTYANAYGAGTTGTGAAEATTTNDVSAKNVVAIVGAVGADSIESSGVVLDNGDVAAAFAEAIGSASAYAQKADDSAGDATAQAGGTIGATNSVAIVGTVSDASYGTYGVSINDGWVVAYTAEGVGDVFASASRNGDANGNATAGIGSEGAAAAVLAGNGVAIIGTASGINGEGGGLQNNYGVYIGESVLAETAWAEGEFEAEAYRSGSGEGAAGASVFGEVAASNTIQIVGTVTAGAPAEGAFVGEGSTGIWVGGFVEADGAFAEGDAYAYAERNGSSEVGDATASASLATSAVNAVVIAGVVGSSNAEATGVHIGEGVSAFEAFAEGWAEAYAQNNGDADGAASATADNRTQATNAIQISGSVGVAGFDAGDSAGVWIGEGVEAANAFAEGTATVTAESNGAGDGNATATASNAAVAVNSIVIAGEVGPAISDDSVGVYIGEGVSARDAFAEGSAYASSTRTGPGAGIATATATDSSQAVNLVSISGTVGADTWNAYGVDPEFVNAANATATSFASASASGPAGSTATATASATALNSVALTGIVLGDPIETMNGSTGVYVANDVTAQNASASASLDIATDGAATGTGTATASASNVVAVSGSVASSQGGSGNAGVWIGGDIALGGLAISLSSTIAAQNDATGATTATGTMTNVAVLAGAVGDNMTDSDGVHVGGGLFFGGDVTASINQVPSGTGDGSMLNVIDGMNIAAISGTVGTGSPGSFGVHIGGNVQVTNTLVSNFVIEGADATNDGTTRGVWIGGSVITGDATSSRVASGLGSQNNGTLPIVPDPLQIGDYVELAGSVFIGADGGLNPYGVAVGGGDDRVVVRDTHFQMEVVNGFDGGSNADVDGRDVITFDTAQIFVSNIDNFEVLNVTDRSVLFLTNPTPYIYAVRDEVNIDYHGILSFGDGGATPPPPIAGSSPVNTLQLDTAMLTIGGIAGVKTPGPGFDDSILKAENNGTGSYEINGDVYNFGTITLSKVLSTVRGTDPHGLLANSMTSFDEAAEQQYWATTGSWAIDPTSAAGDQLTINGNYTAGSDIIVDAFVYKTGSASDTVVINGDVAGVTTIWVNNTNAFGQGALTGRGSTDGILLVDVNNAQDPGVVGAAFVLGNTSGWNWSDPGNFPEPEIQVGAFVYDLQQGGPDGKEFYLQSQLLDQVPAYTVMTSAIQQHFYAELGTLYQRMGELRHADTGPKANSSFFEFWLRAYGQDVEIDPKEGFGFDMTSKGFMIGGDYAIRNWIAPQSRLHLGAFGGYGWTKLDNIEGSGNSDGKTDGYTLGLYATYFDTAKKGQGLYADAVAKFNFLDSEYSSSTRSTKAKSDDFAWGASLEVGYGIGLGNGFIIQPQGQLSYMEVGKEKVKETSPGIPLDIEREKAESLRGRLGLQIQNTWTTSGGTQFSPYVIGNVLHEFMGDNTTKVAGTEFSNDMGGTWFNAGAGFTVDFGNVGLYGHVEYNFGNRVEGLGAGLGVKVRLGGSTPVAAAPAPTPAPAVAPKKNFIVFFDFDRSNITSDAQSVIDQAASTAKAGNVARLQLTGHTDRSGSEQYNMALSLRRGEAVKQALIARGIPAASISIIGRGETQPLVPTADGVREPQNRRVEILL